MSMMNSNGISTVQFQSLGKKLVKSNPTSLKTDRIGIIRTGQQSQNKREETITIHVNPLQDVHVQEVEADALEMTEDALEIIEDVPETNVIIVDSNGFEVKT